MQNSNKSHKPAVQQISGWMIGGPVAAAVVLGLAVGFIVWCWRRRRRAAFFQPSFQKPDRDSGHDYESQDDHQHDGGFQQYQQHDSESEHDYEFQDDDQNDEDSENDYVNVSVRPLNHAMRDSSARGSNAEGLYLSYSSLDVNNIYANYKPSENDNY